MKLNKTNQFFFQVDFGNVFAAVVGSIREVIKLYLYIAGILMTILLIIFTSQPTTHSYHFISIMFYLLIFLTMIISLKKIWNSRVHIGSAYHIPQKQYKQSPEDFERILVHETGHLMACAVFEDIGLTLISQAKKDYASKGEPMGYVNFNDLQHDKTQFNDSEYYLRHMFVLLGGYAGEKYILGRSSDGVKHDLERWQANAHNYLMLEFEKHAYILKPTSEFDALLNSKTLTKLKVEILSALQEFFEHNHKHFIMLKMILSDGKIHNKDELWPIIVKMKEKKLLTIK